MRQLGRLVKVQIGKAGHRGGRYPGSLLQGRSLGGATPDPISVDRAGGTVTINLLNGSEEVSRTVDEVRYDSVIQAMNDIIDRNTGVLPAAFTYQMSEVQSPPG